MKKNNVIINSGPYVEPVSCALTTTEQAEMAKPPETEVQRQCREFWTVCLGASSVGWGRDKNGKFHAEFARHAEAAWIAAQASKQ